MDYDYQDRVVVFLDVLGFQEKLLEFEKEAEEKLHQERDEDYSNLTQGQIFRSQKANLFIDTFRNAVSKLDGKNFRYYLFSDNICITADPTENTEILLDLLLVITDLYFDFAKEGYFLRGGIDFGKFIDDEFIAVGSPLSNAYQIEQKIANFPRIVISENFHKIFETYRNENTLPSAHQLFINYLIKSSCELNFLNVFIKVLKTDEKIDLLRSYSEIIKQNLTANSNNEKIYLKYEWLRREFNVFIEEYTTTLAFQDENFYPEDNFINEINTLKI